MRRRRAPREHRQLCSLGQHEAPEGDTALIAAIKAGQLRAAALLLRSGAAVDARSEPDSEYEPQEGGWDFQRQRQLPAPPYAKEYTPLLWAVYRGDVRAVQLLLRYGADTSLREEAWGEHHGDKGSGKTPLSLAHRSSSKNRDAVITVLKATEAALRVRGEVTG